MKKARILSFMLVLCLMLGVLASCGGGGDGGGTTEAPGGTTAAPGGTAGGTSSTTKWDNVDIDGVSLRIEVNVAEQSAATAAGADHSIKYIKGADDSLSTDGAMLEVIKRNDRVAAMLGIDPKNDITYIEDETSTVGQLLGHYQENAQIGDAPDILISQNYGLIRAEINGLLYNVKEDLGDTERNLFDFEDDGWYRGIMDSTTLDSSKMYILSGDYLFDALRMSYNCFVNIAEFNKVFSAEGGISSLYGMIENNTWTYDEFLRMVQISGDTGVMDDEAFAGVAYTSNFATRSFFFSSCLDLFAEDGQGGFRYVSSELPLHNYADKVMAMMNDQKAVIDLQDKVLTRFMNSKAMFVTDQFLMTLEGATFTGMKDEAGVILYPKYDTSKPWRTLVSDNSLSGAISFDTLEFYACSAFLQLMTEESDEVVEQYFDVGLKFKNNTSASPEQVEILETIRQSLASPLEFLFDNYVSREITSGNLAEGKTTACTVYDILDLCVTGKTNIFSSRWNAEIDQKQQKLQAVIEDFKNRN